MKKGVLYETYKVYDGDSLAVCRFIYNTKGMVEAYRKCRDGKELALHEIDYGFAVTCFDEGDPCTKEFYDNYKG